MVMVGLWLLRHFCIGRGLGGTSAKHTDSLPSATRPATPGGRVGAPSLLLLLLELPPLRWIALAEWQGLSHGYGAFPSLNDGHVHEAERRLQGMVAHAAHGEAGGGYNTVCGNEAVGAA